MGGCALIMKLFFWRTGGFLLAVGLSGRGAGFFWRNKNVPFDGGLAFTEGGKENVLTQTSIE
jgi:hypothetical protein